MALSELVRAEALLGGLACIASELRIVHYLQSEGRLLYYYHAIPLFSGVLLVMSAVYPQDATLSIAATLSSCITALNMHNTFYVHVVMLRRFVAEVRTDNARDLITDLFLPRYTARFRPWGVVAQFVYSLLMCGHLLLRSYATRDLLLEGTVVVRR